MNIKDIIDGELSEEMQEIQNSVQKRIDLAKLNLAQDLSKTGSSIALSAILMYLGFFALLMLNIGIAYLIAQSLGTAWGFIIVGGFYVLLSVIIYLMRKKLIQRPVIKTVINLFFNNHNQDV